MEVKKIGSTFMATVDVIKEAAAQGVNFIITHEPTWFNGIDRTDWVEEDPGQAEFWKHFGQIYQIPKTTLKDLAAFFREKAGMDVIQLVGNPDMPVERVSVLVGGGSLGLGREEMPMIQMFRENLDVAICGDITEWTLSAYVRDAAMLGFNKGMLVLGHERTEEWGMKHLTTWLESISDGIPAVFLDAGEPFTYDYASS